MEIVYKREMNHNYMILDANKSVQGYESRMLEANNIDGLLGLELRQVQNGIKLYYEITSLQQLDRILYRKTLGGAEIKKIVSGILKSVAKANEYMLNENRILMDPECIYLDIRTMEVKLCLVPGYDGDFRRAFTALLKSILDAADRDDRDGVMLAYSLFETSERDNYSSAEMMELINTSGKGHVFAEDMHTEDKRIEDKRIEDKYIEDSHVDNWRIEDRGVESRQDSYEDYGRKEPYREAEEQKTQIENHKNKSANGGILKIILECFLLLFIGEGVIYMLWGIFGVMFYGAIYSVFVAVIFVLLLVLNRNSGKKRQEKVNMEIPSYQIHAETYEEYREKEEAVRIRRMEESRADGTRLLCDMDMPKKVFLESIVEEVPNVDINYTPFVIGSHDNLTDNCIRRSTISRMHVRIDKRENVHILTDLNSTNGTIVNGYRLNSNETVSIKEGDRIYLADVGFVFHEFG